MSGKLEDVTLDEILAAARAVSWDSYRRDEYALYRPHSVVPAFTELLAADSETSSCQAYHAILNAVAHDHSGTVYPAAVPALPLLGQVLMQSTGWPGEP